MMMRSASSRLLLVLLTLALTNAIQLLNHQVQLKTGNMLGSVGVSMAQWDLEFDEELYYFEAPPCAPGLTRTELTASSVAADPCWAGCDFLSSDPAACGQPFNTSDPECQQLCADHPQRAILCNFEERPWYAMQPDVETPLYNLTIGLSFRLRFNWLQVEQGFRWESITTLGQVAASGLALMDSALDLDSDNYCFGIDSPDPWANTCPSSQCFHYGTWEFVGFVNAWESLDDYSCTSSFIVRTFDPPSPNARRTEPRPDAPQTYQVQSTPLHTPVQFGVTVDVHFDPFVEIVFFQLTTPYCGFINAIQEKAEWDRVTARVVVGVSTDGNPFPVSIFEDIMFLDMGTKPLWICPAQPPGGNVTVFFAVARFTSAYEPPLSNPELHYFTVDYYRPEDDWKKFRVGATSHESCFSRHTNFPPLANWGLGLAANLFRASCPDPSNLTGSLFFDCRSGSSLYGTCLDFSFGLPVDPWTISLVPVPGVVRAANPEGFGNIIYPALQNTTSRRLSAFLVLRTSLDGSVVSQALGPEWHALWPRCVLHIGSASPIASIDGQWLTADLALTPTTPQCNYSQFKQLSDQITSSIDDMSANTFEAYSQRVLIDEMTFHDPWQACNLFVVSELSNVSVSNVTLFDSIACLDSTQTNDPCCNNALSWTECCAPRDTSTRLETLSLNKEVVEQTCRFTECVQPLLDEYYRAALNFEVGGCTGPDLSLKLRAPIRTYRDCREAAFGNDFEPPACVTDQDCTSLAANTSTYCNQVTRQCAFDFDEAVEYFFDCLASNVPIEPRIKLVALNNWTVDTELGLAPLLRQRYGTAEQCIDKALGLPWSDYNEHLGTSSILGGCPVCLYQATDVSYQPPPWCEIRPGSECYYTWDISTSSLGCETPVCNWDQSDACDSSLEGSWFCGVCESDSICTEISGVAQQNECDALPSVCFLANGDVRTDISEAQCIQEAFSCTQRCGDGECSTQAECEATGYCEPDDQIYDAMTDSEWDVAIIPTGFCAVPMEPFDSPDCSTPHLGSLPSSYGCVVYADCVGVAHLTCTPNYYTEELCATLSPDAVWWPRYGNESNCLSIVGCKEELVGLRSLSSLGTRLRSPKDQEQCSLCGGTLEPLAQWVRGRWLPGTARQAQWMRRALVSRYRLTDSIDFEALYQDIYTSSRAAVAFQLQNNIQCSYQTIDRLLNEISCACTDSAAPRGECFSGGFITSVGVGQACPSSSNTIIAPPAKLVYNEDSVSAELKDQCVVFTIDRISSRFFYGQSPPPISTGFVPRLTIRGWNAVINGDGALVGRVIGDGIELHFTQNGKYMLNLQVCLLIGTSTPSDDDDDNDDDDDDVMHNFSEYSLGYWTGKVEPATVEPYFQLTNTTAFGGYVCSVINLPQTGKPISFVPIRIRSDWMNKPSARFSENQKALLYIVATFYAMLCCGIAVQLLRLVWMGAWSFTVGTNYIWALLFFMTVIRAVYIYLVAADVLGQQYTHLLIDFWMMDLPTLLYLIVNSIVALTFLFLLLGSRNDKFQSDMYFGLTVTVVSAFIVAIFVAIILAFNFAVVDTQGAHGPALCSSYNDNSGAARAIRIVYECLLFIVALTIAVNAGFIAAKLFWDMREQASAYSLLALGIVSSFGILADSLAFLIYYIVNNPSPYFAIVLIFTEILPITFLVARVSTRQIKNQQRNPSTRSSMRLSSAKSGHVSEHEISGSESTSQ